MSSQLPRRFFVTQWYACLLTGCLLACLLRPSNRQQVYQGQICPGNCTCFHVDFKFVDFNQSRYTDTRATDPSANPLTSGVLQDSRYSTYLCPSLPVEHRPSTTPRHRTLFWTALTIPVQLVPCCFSSASMSRLQLLRGRPLFFFTCWFQVRAWRVVLDAGFMGVCPIQPHFLCSICSATGSCHARSHRSSFRVFSCQRIS